MTDGVQAEELNFKREKWEAEQRRLEKELALRERELALKEVDARRSRWWNPLVIAILGASAAAAGNAYVSWQNSVATLQVETFKAEAARILEALKASSPDTTKASLRFLLATGLIQDPGLRANVGIYIGKEEVITAVTSPEGDPACAVVRKQFGDYLVTHFITPFDPADPKWLYIVGVLQRACHAKP